MATEGVAAMVVVEEARRVARLIIRSSAAGQTGHYSGTARNKPGRSGDIHDKRRLNLNQNKESPYKIYLKSDVWKCKKSAAGAHYWIETRTLSKDNDIFQCVHCGEERVLSNPVGKNR